MRGRPSQLVAAPHPDPLPVKDGARENRGGWPCRRRAGIKSAPEAASQQQSEKPLASRVSSTHDNGTWRARRSDRAVFWSATAALPDRHIAQSKNPLDDRPGYSPLCGNGWVRSEGTGKVNFIEAAGKAVLADAGIAIPAGALASTAAEAESIARRIGPCVIKAQVPTGKRGKAGGIKVAQTPDEARAHAAAILGMAIGDYVSAQVLVDPLAVIKHELYAAILNDPATKGPLLLFSAEGGMDIEELVETRPGALLRFPIDIRHGLDSKALDAALPKALPCDRAALLDVLQKLYVAYAANDAELLEINPLIVTDRGDLIALDCKLTVDDGALPRREALAKSGSPDKLTALEERGKALGLKYIELDGSVGVLANGAGLTMTTMDAVRHFGGEPANFMEIGGESYTKAKPALELVLSNPRVKCLLVNFCGAFARTDVMAEGVINAWQALKPTIPIIFTIHGTGEDEAIAMVQSRLGITPHDLMDDAVKAAVAAAKAGAA